MGFCFFNNAGEDRQVEGGREGGKVIVMVMA